MKRSQQTGLHQGLPPSIRLVLFDMAGTTVDDRACGTSLVIDAMSRAFEHSGIRVDAQDIGRYRGTAKRDAIAGILKDRQNVPAAGGTPAAERIYQDFLGLLNQGICLLKEMDGTGELFRKLKARGIRIGVGSGFPTAVVHGIVSRFGWKENGLVDYVGTAESVGAGRPDPKMIFDMMNTFSVTDPRQVVKVGDTVVDIQEGKNAGVWTVGVCSGTQPRERLLSEQPDFLVQTIRALFDLFP